MQASPGHCTGSPGLSLPSNQQLESVTGALATGWGPVGHTGQLVLRMAVSLSLPAVRQLLLGRGYSKAEEDTLLTNIHNRAIK